MLEALDPDLLDALTLSVLVLIILIWYAKEYIDWGDKILGTKYYYKLQYHGSRLFRILSQNRNFALLILAWIILTIVVLFVPEGERFNSIISNVISILIALLITYLSIDYLLRYSRRSERLRIKSQESIVSHYENDDSDKPDLTKDFINMNEIEGWQREDIDKVPAVVEQMPNKLRKLSELEVEPEHTMYEVDEDIAGIIEPEEDIFLQEFKREGRHYSGLLFRVNDISDDGLTFQGGKTTYYRSFKTNFCPDLEFNNGETTLRKLTDSLLFDIDNRELKKIGESPLSDHLGVACMCVTTDGDSWMFVRSPDVAVEQLSISLPVSGTASLSAGGGDISEIEVGDFMYKELNEELGVRSKDIKDIIYLGTVRRMERLGLPDAFCITVLKQGFKPTIGEDEYVDVIECNLDIELENPESILNGENADELIDTYFSSLNKDDRDVSTGLLSCIHLIRRMADSVDDGSQH